jgi:hypothetical protein
VRTLLPVVAFLSAACATLAAAWHVIGGLEAPLGTGGAPPFDLPAVERVRSALARLAEAERKGRSPRVVLLGDSTAIWFGDRPNVAQELERSLQRSGLRRAAVVAAAYPMMTPVDYFYAAHEIAAARPDAVVATLNLRAIGQRIPRTDMAGMIPPTALPWALAHPLHRFGLTFDRLLLATAIVQTEAAPLWRPVVERQTRLGDWRALQVRRDLARDSFGEFGIYLQHLSEQDGRVRGDREAMRWLFGEALDGITADHPVAQLIGGTIAALREEGVQVVVYVNPVNLEWLRRLGMGDEAGLERTIGVLRAIAASHGARLVDLHTMLPDAAFVDASGHMDAGPPYEAARRIAGRLAGALAPSLVEAR